MDPTPNELTPLCAVGKGVSRGWRGLGGGAQWWVGPSSWEDARLGELSYVHGASSTPLLGETIFQNLLQTAGRFGDREALVVAHQDRRFTYRELVDECEVVAREIGRASCRERV